MYLYINEYNASKFKLLTAKALLKNIVNAIISEECQRKLKERFSEEITDTGIFIIILFGHTLKIAVAYVLLWIAFIIAPQETKTLSEFLHTFESLLINISLIILLSISLWDFIEYKRRKPPLQTHIQQ